MVDDIRRYPDFSVAVVCQYWMAAVGVAGTAREVAAGQVNLEPVTGGKGVTDLTEIEGVRCRMTGQLGPPVPGRNTKVFSRAPSRIGTMAWKPRVFAVLSTICIAPPEHNASTIAHRCRLARAP